MVKFLEVAVRIVGVLMGIFFIFKFPEDLIFWAFFIVMSCVPSSYEVFLKKKNSNKVNIVFDGNGKGGRVS